MNRITEIAKKNQDRISNRRKKKNDKREDKKERVENRRSFRLDKIKEVTAKAYAEAEKRKWLVFLIGALIAAYFIFKGMF